MVAMQPPPNRPPPPLGPNPAPHWLPSPLGGGVDGVELLLAWQVVDVTTVHQ